MLPWWWVTGKLTYYWVLCRNAPWLSGLVQPKICPTGVPWALCTAVRAIAAVVGGGGGGGRTRDKWRCLEDVQVVLLCRGKLIRMLVPNKRAHWAAPVGANGVQTCYASCPQR